MDIRFVMYPVTDRKCYACGTLLRRGCGYLASKRGVKETGMPRWVARQSGRRVCVCPVCLAVCLMKDNGTAGSIREGEFSEKTMASVNRRHRNEFIARISAGEDYMNAVIALQEKAAETNARRKH